MEEIKSLTKRKPQQHESHFDDCGSDVEPIDVIDNSNFVLLATSRGSLDNAVAYSLRDDRSWDDLSSSFETYLLDDAVSLGYLVSSEVEDDNPDCIQRPPGAVFVVFDHLDVYMHSKTQPGYGDVMDIFGGESGVSKICIRRRLATAKVFEVVTGSDLTVKEEQRVLFEYIKKYQPKVIVAGPPYTAFSSLSRINLHKFPESYQETRRIGLVLAHLTAELMQLQISAGRYLL